MNRAEMQSRLTDLNEHIAALEARAARANGESLEIIHDASAAYKVKAAAVESALLVGRQ